MADVRAFDLHTRRWSTLPPLPEPRYAGTMQLWNGRLHFLGGARQDRYTPAADHWSLAATDGRTVGETWREEAPIPRGGMHRASIIARDALYVFGGQEGDFTPVAGDPDFTCNPFTVEHIYPDVYRLQWGTTEWERLPDMPVAASHIEFSVVARGEETTEEIIILGGAKSKDPDTFDIELTDAIQVFNLSTQSWRLQGTLPFRVKACLVALHENGLYFACGQRDYSATDPRPGAIEKSTWRAQLPANW